MPLIGNIWCSNHPEGKDFECCCFMFFLSKKSLAQTRERTHCCPLLSLSCVHTRTTARVLALSLPLVLPFFLGPESCCETRELNENPGNLHLWLPSTRLIPTPRPSWGRGVSGQKHHPFRPTDQDTTPPPPALHLPPCYVCVSGVRIWRVGGGISQF
jgi:hypothetical protein